jgi:hypothetical protein
MHKQVMLVLCSLAFSCATVRVVKSQPGKGGELAVKDGFIGEPASVIADRTMSANCSRGYVVTEEGEHVVGSTSRTSGSEESKGSVVSSKSSKSISSETSTSDVTEWRIKFKCKKAKAS